MVCKRLKHGSCKERRRRIGHWLFVPQEVEQELSLVGWGCRTELPRLLRQLDRSLFLGNIQQARYPRDCCLYIELCAQGSVPAVEWQAGFEAFPHLLLKSKYVFIEHQDF